MKTFLRSAMVWLLCVSVAFAEIAPSTPHREAATQAELDQLLAPIALYPDSLLSQILMASTYPLEVVEAARWSRANPGLRGQDAVAAVDQQDWDASVKALVAFPQVLALMDQRLEWTERLGDVFVAQEPQVMETVQGLRQKAYAAGNLQSSGEAYVSNQDGAIAIEPVSPQVVYVPYYDPWTVYGPWWWPAYPPVFWAPWPGYFVTPGFAFAWGVGIVIGPRFFFSACDWRAHRVTVVNVFNRPGVRPVPTVWRHDPGHRRGVPYHIASLQQHFGPSSRATADPRRDFHWRDSLSPATRNSALNRAETQPTHARPGRAWPPTASAAPRSPAPREMPRPPVMHTIPHPPVYAQRPTAPAPGRNAAPAGRQHGEWRGR